MYKKTSSDSIVWVILVCFLLLDLPLLFYNCVNCFCKGSWVLILKSVLWGDYFCLQTCQACWVLLFTVKHCRFVLQLFAKRQDNQYRMEALSSLSSEMGKKILLSGQIWVKICHNPLCLRMWPRACVFLDTQNKSCCSLHSPPNCAFRNGCVKLFCDGVLGIILRREVHEVHSHKVK